MDISQQFLIDMALNIGGYVLAGLAGAVVYSLLHRRRRPAVAVETTPAEVSATDAVSQVPGEKENRRIEFIKLGERPEQVETDQESSNAPAAGDRRNRSEIIRIARTMLKAGASEEKIKRLIPISDAELSLLSMSKS